MLFPTQTGLCAISLCTHTLPHSISTKSETVLPNNTIMTVLFPLPPSTLPIYLYPSFLLYILTSQILQCVAMNLTLIYSLLAYSSIRQRDFSGLYVSPLHACVLACVHVHVHVFVCAYVK